MAVEQKIIMGSVDGQRVYQSFIKEGDAKRFDGVKKEDKKHPLVGKVYRFRLKTNAELNAEFGYNMTADDTESEPFLTQVIAANGRVVFKEIKSANEDRQIIPLYEIYLDDVKGDTNPFYNITDVTDIAVPPILEETKQDYLIRLKQFGRRPEACVMKSVLGATSRMDYLTASPMTLI